MFTEVVAATPTAATPAIEEDITPALPATSVPLPSPLPLSLYPQPVVIRVSSRQEAFSLATANRTPPDDALDVIAESAVAGPLPCPPPGRPTVLMNPADIADPRLELLTVVKVIACGYVNDQRVTVTLNTPDGRRYALPERASNDASSLNDFSYTFRTNLDDSPGRYTLTFTGSSGSASIDIDIPAPDGPRLRVVDRTSNGAGGRLLLYNFAPRERLRLFAYNQAKFEGWQDYEIDERGRLEINLDPADRLDLFLVLGGVSGPVTPFDKYATYRFQRP